jgi:hypothetical protein
MKNIKKGDQFNISLRLVLEVGSAERVTTPDGDGWQIGFDASLLEWEQEDAATNKILQQGGLMMLAAVAIREAATDLGLEQALDEVQKLVLKMRRTNAD